MIDDLPDDSPPPCCPSCGVAYVDHLGLHGTCAEVLRLRATMAAEWGESGPGDWDWERRVWSRVLDDGRELRVWRADDSKWAHGYEDADTWGVTVYAGRHRWALDAMTAADAQAIAPKERP